VIASKKCGWVVQGKTQVIAGVSWRVDTLNAPAQSVNDIAMCTADIGHKVQVSSFLNWFRLSLGHFAMWAEPVG
jgi:hypothetical protein